MSIIISCASIKGGCSKTTTAINFAAAVAEKGYMTLIVDMDPQANASTALNINKTEFSTSDVLMPKSRGGKAEPIENVIYETKHKNLHIVPSHMSLSAARLVMNDVIGRESVLRKELMKPFIQNKYDFIFIDTAPSVDILLVNALAASNYVIGCSSCEYLALEGIELMLDTFNSVKESDINRGIKLLGVVATKNNTTTHAKEVLDTLKDRYPILGITKTSTKVNEATRAGIPVVYNTKNNPVSDEYRKIAKKLIDQYEREML